VLGQSRFWAVLWSILAASLARGEERPKFADLISRYDQPTVGTDSTEGFHSVLRSELLGDRDAEDLIQLRDV
jgi:hypothetical protein